MVRVVSTIFLASQLAWFARSASGATQLPLAPPLTGANPFETTSSTEDPPSLHSLTTDEFSTFKHPSYPHHALRIKKAPDDWCDPSVKKYTGYIDISPVRHLFFYFFESRRDPEKDDVMLWTNGGPGGSSSTGLFMELGPCTLVREDDGKDETGEIQTKLNPYSWNELANIFFIDQPAGTGFSYAEVGERVLNTEEAAKDIADFLYIFFDTFKSFQNRTFHFSGESYAGRYLPVFAAEIYEQNKRKVEEGKVPIKIESIMIGNGWTSQYHVIPSYYDMVCTTASLEPVTDIQTCVTMKTILPRCKKMLKDSCYDTFDMISCTAARDFCMQYLDFPAGVNVYDLSKPCIGVYEETLCYPQFKIIREYLSYSTIRSLLGAPFSFPDHNDTSQNWEMAIYWFATLDSLRPRTEFYVENLLDRGVRVLLYAGTYDWSANWVGIKNMVNILDWGRVDEFSKEWREWRIDGSGEGSEVAGRVKDGGGLSFATINGAGHMAPYDKPKEALEMVRRWLKREPL